MKYRKLRIAWSVVWGAVAVLFVVLWIRSCYVSDSLSWNFSTRYSVKIFTMSGKGNADYGDAYAETWVFKSYKPKPEQIVNQKLATNSRLFGFYEWPPGGKFPGRRGIFYPMWSPVLIIALISGLPWCGRFSLRTLLIVTTLVAMMLGLIVWAMQD